MVSNGYIVPFVSNPQPTIAKNNKSCVRNKEFSVLELRRIQKLQCINNVLKKDSLVVLPLLVVISNKLHLVVDALRYIKQFVNKRKVKLDSLDNFAFLV